MRRAALLFDLDGTLTDTDHLHFETLRDTLGAHGVAVDRPLYEATMVGAANADIAARFLPHLPVEEGLAVMMAKEAQVRARITSLTRAAGLTELLAFAAAQGLPCALVTNAPRANAAAMLAALDLSERFHPLVLGDELERGKPDPLPYVTALETLGAQAGASVAFEDSRSGVRAAAAAGVTTIGIGAATPAEELRACGAAIVAQDFTDPELWRLMRRTVGIAEGAEP